MLALKDFLRAQEEAATSVTAGGGSDPASNNLYYLAGSYDPNLMTVSFQTGVLEEEEKDTDKGAAVELKS